MKQRASCALLFVSFMETIAQLLGISNMETVNVFGVAGALPVIQIMGIG
ncbi:hypothetical protein AVE81_002473 [Salmonella enterica subsp. diarizonae]|nr:hypothetical protein [Salmonella enterica subsp. diarizonae]EDW9101674.1 hypothetical protein [Salmonella enterica subsp. diarizonae]